MTPNYIIKKIWEQAKAVPGYDSNIWRKDLADAWIRFESLGERSKYGWAISHYVPICHGGTDDINNMIAIHWRNELEKGNNYPIFTTAVTSEGNTNIEKIRRWSAQ